MKFICNTLYKHLLDPSLEKQVLYLTNEQCDACAEGIDLTDVEGMIM